MNPKGRISISIPGGDAPATISLDGEAPVLLDSPEGKEIYRMRYDPHTLNLMDENTALKEKIALLEKQSTEGSLRASYWWCEMDKVIKELREALTTITVQCDEVKSQGSNYALLSRIYRTAFKALKAK